MVRPRYGALGCGCTPGCASGCTPEEIPDKLIRHSLNSGSFHGISKRRTTGRAATRASQKRHSERPRSSSLETLTSTSCRSTALRAATRAGPKRRGRAKYKQRGQHAAVGRWLIPTHAHPPPYAPLFRALPHAGLSGSASFSGGPKTLSTALRAVTRFRAGPKWRISWSQRKREL